MKKTLKNYSPLGGGSPMAATLLAMLFLWSFNPGLIAQSNVKEYFRVSYEPITFSKNEISGNNVFYLIARGKATAIKNFPVPLSEARATIRVVAKHKLTNSERILNPGYTIQVKPFPKKKGQSYEVNKRMPLQFPKVSQSGNYAIVGKIIKAEIKLPLIGWQDITKYLFQARELGSVKYIAPNAKKTK